MITKAHYDSKQFIIDPAYSIHGMNPEPQTLPDAPFWLYGHYECEAFILEKMVRAKTEAKLLVGYTSNRRKPASDAYFSIDTLVSGTIEFRAVGEIAVTLNGEKIYTADASDRKHTLHLPQPGKLVIHLHSDDTEKNIPALLPLNVKDGWLYSPTGEPGTESAPVCKPQREDGLPPHLEELSQIPLSVCRLTETLYDAGVQVFAYVDIQCEGEPAMFVGESLPEVENNDMKDREQTLELVPDKDRAGLWSSKVPLALRYIRIENVKDPKVSLRALFTPAEYKGAFAVQDVDDLSRIWMHAAYTLRLCMMHFLVDGVKRDRLPWAGDLAVSLLGNAYSFGDAAIVRDSLSVLGATGIAKGHINDIPDYTMWWIINHLFYQQYFNDKAFLELEYPRITETLDILLGKRDENGFLTFGEKDWLFIDWVPGSKVTAVQILFAQALKSAAGLADRMNDSGRAAFLRSESGKLFANIKKMAFCPENGLFRSEPGKDEFLRHPNLLAAAFGFVSGKEAETIADALIAKDMPAVGTPYMSIFEAKAIACAGKPDAALAKIREIWGGMLAIGATTFFEGFIPEEIGKQHYVFYDRPFGKSLCHAWGAGPLFLLPQLLAGLEPVEDGWTKFSIRPLPGVTLAVSVPTPYGIIQAEIEDGKVAVLTAPDACSAVQD